MELFLNLVWAATSIALILAWIWSIRKGYTEFEWTALIAIMLLIMVLFPAISMTDDLMAMNVSAEVEHALRRSELPPTPAPILGFLSLFAAIALIVLRMNAPRFFSLIRPRVFAAVLLTGFIRAFGVRPPPAAALSAC